MTAEKEADAETPLVLRIQVQTMAETAILILGSSGAEILAGETAAEAAEIEREGPAKTGFFVFYKEYGLGVFVLYNVSI